MAKDARGHGSNSRGARAPDFGARAVESPTANKPSGIFKPGTAPATGRSADALVANALAGGHPKSSAVPVHPAQDDGHAHFRQVAANNAAFMAKYGGPRDHAREQRAFNSGKREISRLKRQGK